MLSQAYNIIINSGVSAPVHVREVFYGLNATDKYSLFQLMATVKLTGYWGYGTQIYVHYATCKADVSLAWEYQKHLSNASCKMD